MTFSDNDFKPPQRLKSIQWKVSFSFLLYWHKIFHVCTTCILHFIKQIYNKYSYL